MSEELKAIYLQPECCADDEFGRVWCEHDSPEPCPDGNHWTKYVIVPEGMALVPVEPTQRMLDEASYSRNCPVSGKDDSSSIYKAMIVAFVER